MLNKQITSNKVIVDCLKSNYRIEVKSITQLSLGADLNAAIYKVQGQSTYFVKLKYGALDETPIKILELFHASGMQQIILPIKTTDGRSILQKADFCLIVYPFIEGVNGFNQKLTHKQWMTLGKALRQVHDFEVPSSLQKSIRQETYSPTWREAVRDLNNLNKPASNDAIAQKFLTFMKDHRLIIERLVKRAEELCQVIKNYLPKFVLCHSDIHGGNVLIGAEGNIYIVDWDDLILAPKERDLMFIGGGVANVWNDPEEEVSFYKGYGKTLIHKEILAYYRHERIVIDIAEYGEALLSNSLHNRLEMYKQFMGMFDPNGVVDIAFKTDCQNIN